MPVTGCDCQWLLATASDYQTLQHSLAPTNLCLPPWNIAHQLLILRQVPKPIGHAAADDSDAGDAGYLLLSMMLIHHDMHNH